MEPHIQLQTDDKEFLEQAIKFYRNSDVYCSLLGVGGDDLEAFKNDMKIFMFIADKRFRSFTESFVRYNITVLRRKLGPLFMACVNNKNYTKAIGEGLGIVSYREKSLQPDRWGHADALIN